MERFQDYWKDFKIEGKIARLRERLQYWWEYCKIGGNIARLWATVVWLLEYSSNRHPDFHMWESRRTMPLIRWLFSGTSRFPPPPHLRSGAAPCSPCFTLIGSLDSDAALNSEVLRAGEGDIEMSANERAGETGEPLEASCLVGETASTKAKRVRFPAESPYVFPRRNRVGRCRWSAGFLDDLPFPLPLHYGADPYSPRFTIIGSQDLDVTSRPNLFTHCKTQHCPNATIFRPDDDGGDVAWHGLHEAAEAVGSHTGPSPPHSLPRCTEIGRSRIHGAHILLNSIPDVIYSVGVE
ncbi:hypothetical protein PR048_025020 [Dryococelus australis]|uniref:Uncharacterized protein n=1 Tax=Dryococelus australis TaxID=614101 RepID=A0ABQ9GQ98_9NEOP|nr:hypothetical protein PR048_025020 [Dryococelus australis]